MQKNNRWSIKPETQNNGSSKVFKANSDDTDTSINTGVEILNDVKPKTSRWIFKFKKKKLWFKINVTLKFHFN